MERSLLNPSVDALEEALPALVDERAAQAQPTSSDQRRLASLLRDHFAMVWRAVRRFGVPAAAADDAAQEVFIVAASRATDIAPGRERQFLYAVAVRVAANHRRGASFRHEEASDLEQLERASEQPNAEALLDQKRRRQLLDEILDELSDDLRTAFVLFELEGLSVPELAEVLGVPLGTAASRLRRAREQFTRGVESARRRLR